MFRSPALASASVEVTLPISQKQCLIITHNPNYQGLIDIGQHTVDELNRRHINHSDESFVSQTEETRPVWFEERPMPEDAWKKFVNEKSPQGNGHDGIPSSLLSAAMIAKPETHPFKVILPI